MLKEMLVKQSGHCMSGPIGDTLRLVLIAGI